MGRKYDYVYGGALVVEADFSSRHGARRRWGDGKEQRVHRMISEIVDGLQVLLSICRSQREEDEERERIRIGWARRKQLFELRQKRERERDQLISEVANNLEQIATLRGWREKLLMEATAEVGSECSRFLEWLDTKVRNLEYEIQLDSIVDRLHERALFPKPDPLRDPEGDPIAE